jgi:SAM-dependent methyltransferase
MDDPDGYFGEPVAAGYDDPSDRMFQPEAIDPAVSLLAELAGSGRALELAIGTGRIGLPLSRRGVPVHGIEMSRAMVARLRGKPGGEVIGVTIGDMATTRVDGTFTVAYLVFNTINNLTSQEAQVACFRNVAAHLGPGGCFVIETNLPHLRDLPPGQDILGYRAGPERIVSYSFDHATQRYRGHYVEFTDGTGEDPVPLRMAIRARPDGSAGRTPVARPLGRLEPRAVHHRQPLARLGLGEARGASRVILVPPGPDVRYRP